MENFVSYAPDRAEMLKQASIAIKAVLQIEVIRAKSARLNCFDDDYRMQSRSIDAEAKWLVERLERFGDGRGRVLGPPLSFNGYG